MARELTPKDIQTRRLRACVEDFPGAETGEYSPKCCRFPKACSPYGRIEAYQAGNLTEADLEPPRKTLAQAMAETEIHTETKTLEAMRVGSSFVIDVKHMDRLTPGDRQSAMDFELDRQRVSLEAYVLSDKLADDTYTQTKRYSTPKTWWDMFKLTYQLTWWLGWFVDKFPVKYEYHDFSVGVQVERFAQYPEADIALPSLGRPVKYERMRYLSPKELEDVLDQNAAEHQSADDRDHINVFSLIPETFDDLSLYTGLPRQWFENAYTFDQDFGLQSKIYVIPEDFIKNKE